MKTTCDGLSVEPILISFEKFQACDNGWALTIKKYNLIR